jgi:hypothetical protein
MPFYTLEGADYRDLAYDLAFLELLPRLYPRADARGSFATNSPLAAETAFRISSLQGATRATCRFPGESRDPFSRWHRASSNCNDLPTDEAFRAADLWAPASAGEARS